MQDANIPEDLIFPQDSPGPQPDAPAVDAGVSSGQIPSDLVFPQSLDDARSNLESAEARVRSIRRQAIEAGTEDQLANNPEFASAAQAAAAARRAEMAARNPFGALGQSVGTLSPEEQAAWTRQERITADAQAQDAQQFQNDVRAYVAQQPAPDSWFWRPAQYFAETGVRDAQRRQRDIAAVESGQQRPASLTASRSAAEGFSRSVLDTAVAGLFKVAGAASAYVANLVPGPTVEPDDNLIYNMGEAISRWASDTFPGDPARQHEFAQKLAQGGGSMLGFMGPNMAAAILGSGPRGMAAVTALFGGAAQGTEAFDEASRALLEIKERYEQETGRRIMFTPTEQDRLIALGLNFLIGTSEALPIAHLFQGPTRPGLRARLHHSGVQAFEEGAQETGQQLASNVVAAQTYEPDRRIDQGVVESGGIGALLGAGMGAVMRPHVERPNTQPPAPQQQQDGSGSPVPPQEPPQPQAAISGFYAPAERAIETSRRVQGPPQAWLNDLKKSGVSNDELDWMGFPQWMEEHQGRPVSREEVAEFIRENGANLVEVVQGRANGRTREEIAQQQYGLPWDQLNVRQQFWAQTAAGQPVKFSSNFPAGVTNPRNFLVQVPGLNYESQHFGGPTVSFIRVGDVAGPNGERVLLVHGNQSELHQEAEKSGYFKSPEERDARKIADRADLAMASLPEKIQAEFDERQRRGDDPRATISWLRSIDPTKAGFIEQAMFLDTAPGTVPNAPLKGDRWWQLGLKLALRQAVAEGYDAVAISTADQVKATDGNAPKSLYDSKMPSWLGKYVKPMGGVVEQVAAGARRVAKTFSSRNDALAVYPRGSLTDKITDNVWAVYSPGRRTIFGRDFGSLIGHVSESDPGIFVATPVDRALSESLKVDETQSRPQVRITPQMRESISKGQPLFGSGAPTNYDAIGHMLRLRRPYRVESSVHDAVLSALVDSKYTAMVPPGTQVGTIIGIEPIRGVSASDAVTLVFRDTQNETVKISLPFGWVSRLRALSISADHTSTGRDALLFLRLGTPDGFANGLGGELRHEATHNLRTRGYLGGPSWSRLVSHGRSLSVDSMPFREFLFYTNHPDYALAQGDMGIEDVYRYEIYSGRQDLQEMLDQEIVTHMLELHHHGYFSDEQMVPVRDILDAMESGELTGGGESVTSEVAMAIAGPRAKTASKGNLAQAQKMAQRGRDPNTIWEATGWGIDPADSKWKWEIDDSKAKLINLSAHLKPMNPTLWQRLTIGKAKLKSTPRWATPKTRLGTSIKLPQILQHPELYKAYPFLQRMSVNMAIGQDIDRSRLGGLLSMSTGDGKRIYRPIRVIAASETEAIDTLLHEIQHYIQNVEGFAPGASATKTDRPLEVGGPSKATFSPDTLNARVPNGDMQGIIGMTEAEDLAREIRRLEGEPDSSDRTSALKTATDRLAEVLRLQPTDYTSAAGEMEAEAVASRRNLTPLERRENMPFGRLGDRTAIRQTPSFPDAANETDRRSLLMQKLQESRRKPVLVGDNLWAMRDNEDEVVYYTGDGTVLLRSRLDSEHATLMPDAAFNALDADRKAYVSRQVERDTRSRNYFPAWRDSTDYARAKYGMPQDMREASLDPAAWMDSGQTQEEEFLRNKLNDLEKKVDDVIARHKDEHAKAMAYYEKVKGQQAWQALNRLSDEHRKEMDAIHDQIQDVREEITYGPLNDLRLEYEALHAEADQIERGRHELRANLARDNAQFRKAVAKLILANNYTGARNLAEAEKLAENSDVWYNSHPDGWGEEGDRLADAASPEIRAIESRYDAIDKRLGYGGSEGSLVGEINARGGTINYGKNRPLRHRRSSADGGMMFAIGGGDPVSLVSFIRAQGGIRDQTGDLRQILDKTGTAGHIPGIINNKTGVPIDTMRERLVEAGYLEESGPDRPAVTTVNDVIELVRRAASGERVFPRGERATPVETGPDVARILDDAYRMHQEVGIEYNLTEAQESRVVDLVTIEGLSVDNAVERAVMESVDGYELGESEAARPAGRGDQAQGQGTAAEQYRPELSGNPSANNAGTGEVRPQAGSQVVPVTPPPVPPSSGGGSSGGNGGRRLPPGSEVLPPDPGRGPRRLGAPDQTTLEVSRNWTVGDWMRAAREKWYSLGRTAETWWNPINGLPQLEQYRIGRYNMLGRIGHAEAMTNQIWKDFKDASKADKKAAYTYLTTRGVSENGISDQKVRQAALGTKRLFNALGAAAVERGLIPQESLDKYRDQYLPRLYLEHILRRGSMLGFSGNARPSDLGWTKKRGDIDKETRVLMGEILDPGYLAARGIFRMHRDMMIIDFLSEISNNDDWVFDRGLMEFNGRRVSPYFLRAEAQALRERADYEPDDGYRNAMLSMAADMENASAPYIRANENVPDGFKQIPDTKRYGMLRGMMVRKEIVDDLLPSMDLIPEDASWYQKFMSPQGGGGKFNALWKAYHVPMNPSTQVRNVISNVIMMNLSGMSPVRIAVALGKAVKEMSSNGPIYKTAVDMGLKTSGFSEQELRNVSRAWLEAEATLRRESAWGTVFYPWQIIKYIHDTVLRGAGDLYQWSEGVFKTAIMVDAVENKGMTPEQAFLEAQKWLFDYSDVSKTVRYLRSAPIGVPFASYYYKVLPRLLEVAGTKPWRFIPYVILPYVMGQLFMNAWNAHDDDEERKRNPNRPNPVNRLAMTLPEYLRTKSYAFIMPGHDARGRWQFFDFGYLLPWSMFHETAQALSQGNITDAMRQAGFLGGPLLNLYQFIASKGTDSFTGRKVVDPRDPTSSQILNTMQWLWDQAAPPLLTSKGALARVRDAYNDVPDRNGDPGLTMAQSIARLFGLNVYPVDPDTSRGRQISRMQFEIKEAEKRNRSVQRDQSLSVEARRRDAEARAADIVRRRRELAEYINNTEVHPRLRIERPRRPEPPSAQPQVPTDLIFPKQ